MRAMHMGSEPVDPKGARGHRSNVVVWVLAASCVFLGAFNLLTLMSDRVHAMAYDGVKAVLSAVVAQAALSRMLSASPTVKRDRQVDVATKALQNEKAAITASKAALEQKHVALEKSHRELNAKHSELTRITSKRAEVVKVASKRLATRTAANALRNVSSVTAQSIPVIGTGIVLAVTAWDIYDACETLKDINEVNAVFDQDRADQTAVCGMKVPTRVEVAAKVSENWKGIYQRSADALNQAGGAITVPSLPRVTWPEVKAATCPVVGTVVGVCP